MPAGVLGPYLSRIRAELRRSFTERYSPHQIASSFSIGVFITMLPTLGLGLIIFVLLSRLTAWINAVALFASVVVLNPLVKWGVYAASMMVGIALLGPIETGSIDATVAREAVIRLWVGNLILAVVATIIAYPLVYQFADAYQSRVESLAESIVEELESTSS